MNRRAFLFAGLAAATAFVPAGAASDLKVIYVGGGDCEPCRRWKGVYKAKWLASAEFKQVTWVEIEAAKLKEAYQERFWPGDLKSIVEQIPRKSGTPRFLVVKDGRIVSNRFGGSTWQNTLADLEKRLG